MLATALLAGVLAPALAAASSLSRTIDSTLARYGLNGHGTAVAVWDLETGTMAYGRNVRAVLAPASNEKLATAATALIRWGADHRFRTEARASGAIDADGVLHGDLHLRGYGDPTLSTLYYQRRVFHAKTSSVAHLARLVREAGVRRITGRVLGDESWFDRRRSVSSWRPGNELYCGPLSALTVNQGYSGGARAAQPAVHAAAAFRDALRSAGIRVDGGAGIGRAPSGAAILATEYSAPLWRVLGLMGKPSDNTIAEMLLKGLGRDFGAGGTTAAGAAVVRSQLVACGAPAAGLRVLDGSGLSYGNRLTAHAVTRLLVHMSTRMDFDTFWSSLAVGGRDGTLRLRMRGTLAVDNVHAKTGTLSIASCLSGYLTTRDREGVAFSILMNGWPLDAGRARAAQDALAAALARADL
jgi:D-alanyl-D-alanine carboxypeptidase/D-alanyl-D-alanine-endopeptidase (penicillin-binding protein 4)